MSRPFLRILLLALLPYAAHADSILQKGKALMECPDSKVCILIAKDKCKVGGLMTAADQYRGYLYENADSCEVKEYGEQHYARLDIEPLNIGKWSFFLVHFDKQPDDGSTNEQHIDNLGFQFGTTNLTFVQDGIDIMAKLDWKREGESKVRTRHFPLRFYNHLKSYYGFWFNMYTFTVELKKDKLINVFGASEVHFLRNKTAGYEVDGTFSDRKFVDKLTSFAFCETSELKEACYGGNCEQIEFSNATAAANCSSRFWFHDISKATFTREWKSADVIECELGTWTAKWNGGFQILDKSIEVQCYAETPGKLTDLFVGVLAGSLVVVVLILIVIAILVWRCDRNRKMNDNRFGTTTRSDSKAETPGKIWSWKKGKSDRPSASNIEDRFQTDKAPHLVSALGAPAPILHDDVIESKESPEKKKKKGPAFPPLPKQQP